MLKKYSFLIIITAFLLLWWLFNVLFLPSSYTLIVINQSEKVVDQLSLFGDAVVTPAHIAQIAPGNSAEISVLLSEQGDLRYQVSQGLTEVDMIIENNVADLALDHAWLLVKPDNRFLIQHQPPAEY